MTAVQFRGGIAPRNEQAFTDMVKQLARTFGFLVYHTFNSQRSDPGFPDLVFVHPVDGRRFWAELKVGKNEPTGHQRAWIAALVTSGEVVFLWRPEHWDEIVDVLSGAIDLEPDPESGEGDAG